MTGWGLDARPFFHPNRRDEMIDQSLETDRETRERVWNVLRNSTITIDDMAGSEEDREARDGFYHEVLLDEQRRKEDRETDRELQKITRVSDWHWARMWARRPYRRLDKRGQVFGTTQLEEAYW